jgi:hypothetical protein
MLGVLQKGSPQHKVFGMKIRRKDWRICSLCERKVA